MAIDRRDNIELIETIRARGYNNEDLLPKNESARNMSTSNYFTMWMGNLHTIPNYASIGGFLVLGLFAPNIIVALILGALLVGLLFAYNGKIGSKYGIPFSIQLVSAYGQKGAKLPGVLRGIITAIAWFGLQTFVGSQALLIILAKFFPGILNIGGDTTILGISIPGLIAFIVFWMINIALGVGNTTWMNRFNLILTVVIYILFIGMAIWGFKVSGGISEILEFRSSNTLSSPSLFVAFILVINSVLAYWAAPTVSASDYTQFAKSNKAQMSGQISGLLVGYIIFAFASIVILVGSSIHYNMEQWDVLTIINQWDSLPAITFATLVILLVTVNSNVMANLNPAAFQLTALFPNKLSRKIGVLIAATVGFLIMPWKLMENADSIFLFLNAIGAIMGPIIAVLLYQYYIIDKQNVDLNELYINPKGDKLNKYHGINIKAYIATIGGALAPLLFSLIPGLTLLSQISFITGFVFAIVIYIIIDFKK